MSDARHFEQRVAAVVYAAERAVTRTEPTPGDGAPLPPAVDAPGPRATGLARRLGLGAAVLDFLWTVVARAVEPRVGAHLRALYGGEARGGVSVGQHAHIAALDADTTRVVLAVIDPRHPLRRHGLIAPLVEDGEDVATRWTAPPRVWQYLRGDDAPDAGVAELGGRVEVPAQPQVAAMVAAASDLRPGMVLARDLIGANGLMMLSATHVLDEPMIQKLLDFEKSFGVELTVHIVAP